MASQIIINKSALIKYYLILKFNIIGTISITYCLFKFKNLII